MHEILILDEFAARTVLCAIRELRNVSALGARSIELTWTSMSSVYSFGLMAEEMRSLIAFPRAE
jgi:hypothetical protein